MGSVVFRSFCTNPYRIAIYVSADPRPDKIRVGKAVWEAYNISPSCLGVLHFVHAFENLFELDWDLQVPQNGLLGCLSNVTLAIQ